MKKGTYFPFKNFFEATCNREYVGTWTSGIPGTLNLNPEIEEKISQPKAKKVLRVVTVVHPPFIQWNETTSKIKHSKSIRNWS